MYIGIKSRARPRRSRLRRRPYAFGTRDVGSAPLQQPRESTPQAGGLGMQMRKARPRRCSRCIGNSASEPSHLPARPRRKLHRIARMHARGLSSLVSRCACTDPGTRTSTAPARSRQGRNDDLPKRRPPCARCGTNVDSRALEIPSHDRAARKAWRVCIPTPGATQ